MAFQEIKDDFQQLKKESKSYLDTNIAYFKLWGFKVTMKSATVILKFIILMLLISLFILFSSIALAIVIGRSLDDYVCGFLIVAGIYLVLGILVSLIKPKIVEGRVLRKFSDIFFND